MFSSTKSSELLFLTIAHYSVGKERFLSSSEIKIALNFSAELVEVKTFSTLSTEFKDRAFKVQLRVITYWPPLIFMQVVWLQGDLNNFLL